MEIKKKLAAAINRFLDFIRERRAHCSAQSGLVEEILASGNARMKALSRDSLMLEKEPMRLPTLEFLPRAGAVCSPTQSHILLSEEVTLFINGVRINSEDFPTQHHYPFNVAILRESSELRFEKPIVFFVGENGSGKSTLLDAITRKCGIHVWDRPRRHLAHENPYEDRLKDFIEVGWTNGRVPGSLFRAQTFHDMADFLDDLAICDPGRIKYHGGRLLNVLSHGEGILSYFAGRFQVKGLYLLDEPEAALSPKSQVRFLKLLHELEASGHAQFIMATHSPILMAYPGAQIFTFDGNQIEEANYEETSHYQVYRQFFSDRSRMVAPVPGMHSKAESDTEVGPRSTETDEPEQNGNHPQHAPNLPAGQNGQGSRRERTASTER